MSAMEKIISFLLLKWTQESEHNPGHICCFFHKGETKKCYEEWMKNRPMKED